MGTPELPYALNYKPYTTEGEEWPLTLSLSGHDVAPENATITLSFEKEAGFPNEFDLVIIDEAYGLVKPVINGSTTIAWDAGQDVRNVRLIAGTSAYIHALTGDLPVAPEQPFLSQNFPNPFLTSTRIQYQLTRRAAVSLVVYNALGQEVQTLVDTQQDPGTFEVVWNGHDSNHKPVPSGVYFYRIVADDFQASGQMTLIR